VGIMRRRGAYFQVAQALEALADLGHRTGDAVSEQRYLEEALTIYETLGGPERTVCAGRSPQPMTESI
jgi:hypothetical protein